MCVYVRGGGEGVKVKKVKLKQPYFTLITHCSKN